MKASLYGEYEWYAQAAHDLGCEWIEGLDPEGNFGVCLRVVHYDEHGQRAVQPEPMDREFRSVEGCIARVDDMAQRCSRD